MYKNKKKSFVLAGIALTFALSACGSSEKLMTDTGSASQKEIAKEEYLNLEALNQPRAKVVKASIKYIPWKKGHLRRRL